MAVVTEIGPDLFRISIYVPQFDLQFNHFLVKHEHPLAHREVTGAADGELRLTGKYQIRVCPHLPHSWDAGSLSKRTGGPFCAPICSTPGPQTPVGPAGFTAGHRPRSNVMDRARLNEKDRTKGKPRSKPLC